MTQQEEDQREKKTQHTLPFSRLEENNSPTGLRDTQSERGF